MKTGSADKETFGPQIEMDFVFMKADGSILEKGAEGRVVYSQVFSTHLLAVDCGAGKPLFVCISTKANYKDAQKGGVAYGARVMTYWLSRWGFTDVHLRAEAEPAMMALIKIVQKERSHKTSVSNTPPRSHTLATCNSMAKLVGGEFRTIRNALGGKTGKKIDPSMIVWAWIGRCVGHMICRFHARKTRKTAYEESTDATYDSEMADFGVCMVIKNLQRIQEKCVGDVLSEKQIRHGLEAYGLVELNSPMNTHVSRSMGKFSRERYDDCQKKENGTVSSWTKLLVLRGVIRPDCQLQRCFHQSLLCQLQWKLPRKDQGKENLNHSWRKVAERLKCLLKKRDRTR